MARGIVFLLIPVFLYLQLDSSMAADISLDSVLLASNPNQTWASPSDTFSLHFLQLNSDSYSLAITFGTDVPIWEAASAGAAIITDDSASFHFLSNGNLQLQNGSGTVIWQSNTSNLGVSHASLDDSGNFLLKNGSVPVWSTFDHPSDVIVPSQNFSTNNALASGLYSFTLSSIGNLTLKWNNSITYWTLGLNSSVNASLTQPSLGLQSIGTLSLYDRKLPRSVIMAYSSDYAESGSSGTGSIFRFLKLDGDGNLRIYSSSGGTTSRWAAVGDQCLVYAYCGNMGICSYNETDPICGCPSQNFEPIDPGDSRKGCKRKFDLQECSSNATMLSLDHTKFFAYPPETGDVYFSGISACKLNCLQKTAPCVASTDFADGTGQCAIKTENFVSGYQSPSLPSTSFVKVCPPASPNPSPSSLQQGSGAKLKGWVIAVVVLATLLGLVSLEGSLWWWCVRKSPRFAALSAQYALLEYASGAPVQFSYKELQRATKGFKEKLGEGGFGLVYKGILTNRTVVAVKQLEGIEQGEKQFRMEVATISSTHHLNLVRLIGFCSEGKHRLLVYEFMKNGSLDSFLFASSDERIVLTWEQRFNIALGTARGITYLHEECRDCIVHCDIKPENILLDENYFAKVSDFGLAKLINPKDHRYRTLTSVRGTRGYLAPEWLANLPITSKSDVYSYGMVLLEIVSGRRNFDISAETNGKKFSLWAYEQLEKGNVRSVVDKSLAEFDLDMAQVLRVIQVSFWCIQEQPSQRPIMGKVVQMLEGVVEIGKPPAPKAVPEGSISGTSIKTSSSILSTFAASAPGPSSSNSTLQTAGMYPEKPSLSLIQKGPY